IESFLDKLSLPVLTDQKEELDKPIFEEEIVDVITLLTTGKLPGPDGFTVEFYKMYCKELTPYLLNMYEESFANGSLPPTLSEALISLILKKGKDPHNCQSYRPISLINCDAKILDKVLAKRLDKVVETLVHPDQVGFIHQRNSTDNIRRFIDIMWHVQSDQ
uniref:Reverse transcriptase domain-containing protein n=1 Tax=Pygocentrus nattereri TaxID=42514 RepID=A0AAR2LBM4_PYGNA